MLIAEFDRLKGWERDGHRSCAHWLAFNTGIDLGAAREKVRAARALEDLPETSAAMSRGALSFAKVRALTRVATAENEGDLLELARGSTAADLERMVRGWRVASAKDEAELERIRHASRTLSVFPGDDGMYVVRARLDPEVGALLMRVVEAACDALYRQGLCGRSDGRCHAGAAASRRVGFAGGAGDGGRVRNVDWSPDRPHSLGAAPTVIRGNEPSVPPRRGARARIARTVAPVPVSGSRAERYQVLLHVEPDR